MDPFPHASWRLIRSSPADGPTNMAIDESMLRAVAKGLVPPTLRFYDWRPPTVSLGRAQLASDVDDAAREQRGYGLVRRPTGGKAILHVDELTYSVVAPRAEPRVTGPVVDSYRRLSAGLVRGLELLGVAGTRADRRVEAGTAKGPVCFEVPSNYEVTASGRKLVGSAQMRADGTVLQHGTVPLVGDIARICAVLRARPDPEQVRSRATTVEHVLGRRVPWIEAVEAMISGFEQVLRLTLVGGGLTAWELERAEELSATKYATPAWTYRI